MIQTILNLQPLRDRFMTDFERDSLNTYSISIQSRVAAVNEIESAEHNIIQQTIDQIKQLYPNFLRYHPVGWEKGYRDMQLLLQYITKAMLLNDLHYLNETLLTWVRTIFKSLNFTPKFLRDSYSLLRENVKSAVKPRSYALVEPYLTHTINYLSDIPEPVRPEV